MTSAAWKGIPGWVLDMCHAHFDASTQEFVADYLDTDGSFVRTRHVDRSRRWWGPGDRITPWGLERIPRSPAAARGIPLAIVEGETDRLALEWLFQGTFVVIAIPGAATWRSEWTAYAAPFTTIYALGDADTAGRAMNQRILTDIPWARPVDLPACSDVRNVLQVHGPGGLDAYLEDADRVAYSTARRRLAAERIADAMATSPTLSACQERLRGGVDDLLAA